MRCSCSARFHRDTSLSSQGAPSCSLDSSVGDTAPCATVLQQDLLSWQPGFLSGHQ